MAIAAEAQFHVLAVDDSPIDRKLIERLLKASSFLVTTVDSGSKALEFLGLPHSVNMVITDYCMPEMSGFDLLKRIKDSSVLKDIPVVIMSSENVPSRINRCLEEGADEFILKPVTPSDMNRLRPHIVKWRSGEQPKSNSRKQDLICTNTSGKSYTNITNGDTKSSKSSSVKRKSMGEGIFPCKCEWMRPLLQRRRGGLESQERMAAFGRVVIFENILIGPVMKWRAVKFPSFFIRPLSLFSFLTFLVFFWLISLLVTGKSDN